jgi:hypothetical protein
MRSTLAPLDLGSTSSVRRGFREQFIDALLNRSEGHDLYAELSGRVKNISGGRGERLGL